MRTTTAFTITLALMCVSGHAATFEEIYAKCKAEAARNKGFDVLRGKVTLYGEDAPSETRPLNRKPNAAETIALRSLLDLHVRCALAPNQMRTGAQVTPSEVPRYTHEVISLLAMLSGGHITYEEHAKAVKERTSAAIDAVAEEYRKYQAKAQADASFLLTCVTESPEKFRGMELQYQIDPVNNAVLSNRGAPTNVRISETEINFDLGGGVSSSISRLTGMLTTTSGSLIVSGRCTKATSKVF